MRWLGTPLQKKKWTNFAGSWTNTKGNCDDGAHALDFSGSASVARAVTASLPLAGGSVGSAGRRGAANVPEGIDSIRDWCGMPRRHAGDTGGDLPLPLATPRTKAF